MGETNCGAELVIDLEKIPRLLDRARTLIDEWKQGCSCARPGAPEECAVCTRAALDAIEYELNLVTRP